MVCRRTVLWPTSEATLIDVFEVSMRVKNSLRLSAEPPQLPVMTVVTPL